MQGYLCQPVEASASLNAVTFQSASPATRSRMSRWPPTAPKDELQKLFGACDAPPSRDPERYLRIRDYLLSPALD